MAEFRAAGLVALFLLITATAPAQVIEFESGGLKYQTLTKNGLTIMVASLPSHVRQFTIVQVAVSNGSPVAWTIKPEDFSFRGSDGRVLEARQARDVVNSLMERASRGDVIKLVTAYENALYGLTRFQSNTNGYEERRQSALAEVSSAKLKAAAAASAIAFVPTKLAPGQTTDGAVFYATAGKPLGPGHVVVRAAGEVFEFEPSSGN
jgi:hypothetical protein